MKNKATTLASCGLAIIATLLSVQAQNVPSKVVVRAGHVLDIKSGKMLADQAIVIEGDKIVSIGPASSAQAVAGATTINLPNSTVLPGLIDSHVHLTGDLKNSGYRSLGISLPRATLTGAHNATDLLGWSYKVGAMEPGKWADLIAVDSDPLQDVTTLEHVKFVMKGGAVIRSDYTK
jgi:imidazolonepropionase-like amidohydrolase